MSRKMKDSDVQWLGEIPSDWKITNLKKVSKIKTGSTPSGKSEEKFSDISGLEWIKTNNLLGTDGISESKLKITSEYEKKATLAPLYSTLVCCIGDIGKLGFNIELVSYNQQINAVNFNNDLVNWKYGFYSLYAQKDQHIAHSNGNVLRILNTENQKKITISIPSMKEQIIIVKVLDKKTTEIDNVVEKTKESIEELKAYKQSLITETVTKGLNPDVPMKDSGIDWIDKIPEHWHINMINNYFYELKSKNKNMIENNLLSLSYGNIIRRNIETTNGLLPASFENYNILKKGDIVLRMTDLQNDKKSLRTGYVTERGIITSAYITLRTKHVNTINSRYTQLYLHSFDIHKGFYGMGGGVRQSVNYNDLKKTPILVPPIEEQTKIVKFLIEKNQQIDNVISRKQQMLRELESYKQSLIYEYVTGKKEVE